MGEKSVKLGKASQAELSAAWYAARSSQKEHLIKIVKELEDGE